MVRSKRRKRLKPIVVCAFSPFAGDGDPHRRQKSEERRKPLQTPLVSQVFLRQRVEKMRRHCSATQRLHSVVPVIWSFRHFFVKFKLFNVLFGLF
jgi:hypothetical protein